MSDSPRFRVTRTLGGVRCIEDRSDESLVAMIVGTSKRSTEKTEAMIRVMVDALNAAVTRRPTNTTPQPPQGD